MGGETFRFPVGTYVKTDKYDHIMMAMKTTLDKTALTTKYHREPLRRTLSSTLAKHLCKMRDELVTLNIVPAVSEWSKVNPNL